MKAALIIGDLNFANINLSTLSKEDEEEQSVQELFENDLYQQRVQFHTRGTNTSDLAFFCNCSLFASPDEVLGEIETVLTTSCKPFTGLSNLQRKANKSKCQKLW